jgi:iron complex outermembrane recepter protein
MTLESSQVISTQKSISPLIIFTAILFLLKSMLSHAQSDAVEPSSDIPVVLTPTRLLQSQADAPASITVLTAEFLKKYGVKSVVEAMRFVPGMEISLADGNQYQVNYHGTNALNPRRMNVMIDNVPMYQSTLAEVRWDTFPVGIDDIDRIEVVRGASSAAYGPNSMMGVVNIITKHPADLSGPFVSTEIGTNRNRQLMLRYGTQFANSDIRLSFEHFEHGGFDTTSGTELKPSSNNDLRTDRFSLSAVTRLSRQTDLRTDMALWSANRGFSRVEPNSRTPAPIETLAGYVNFLLSHQLSEGHRISLHGHLMVNDQTQEWQTAYPAAALLPQMFDLWRANPGYAKTVLAGKKPSGGTAADDALVQLAQQAITALGAGAKQLVLGNVNQNYRETRTEIEAQDIYVFSPTLRSVVGLGLRHNRGSSETYFGGSVDNSVIWGFGNLEYKIGDRYTINAGAYTEASNLSETSIAPRLALNVKLDSQQSLRFIASKGLRTPGIHEQKSNWSYTFRNTSNPAFEQARLYQSAISTTTLSDERVISYEVGYFGKVPKYGLTIDVKGFYERLYQLISERLSLGTFAPTNNGRVNLHGIETQLSADFSANWSVFANYTYLNSSADQGSVELTQYGRHTGAIGVSRRLNENARFSIDYLYQPSEVPLVNHFGRLDLNFFKTVAVGNNRLELMAGLQRLDNNKNIWIRGSNPITYAYPSRYQFQAGVRCAF